jgi:hypothetical protein
MIQISLVATNVNKRLHHFIKVLAYRKIGFEKPIKLLNAIAHGRGLNSRG